MASLNFTGFIQQHFFDVLFMEVVAGVKLPRINSALISRLEVVLKGVSSLNQFALTVFFL